MKVVMNQLEQHREKLEDIDVIEKIIHSLTSKFNYVMCFIEESGDWTPW